MKSKPLAVALLLTLFLAKHASAQVLVNLPQIANGSFGNISFRTTFILFNNTEAGVSVNLKLTDDNGNPLIVTLGALGSGSQFSISLGAGAISILQTDGLGNGVVGAATATATAPIGVSAIFTIYDANGNYMTEAGVGNSEPLNEFVFPVDVGGGYDTGLALFNAGTGNAGITAILTDTDGKEAARTTMSLNGGAHKAVFVAGPGQLFPTITGFRGTLVIRSSVPVAAVVLRQYQSPTQLSYTSLPVVARSSSKLALNLAQVANGSYGTINFKTSFLIFNISPSPAHITLTLTQNDGSPFTVTIPGAGPGTGTNSRFNLTLAAGASVFLETDGLGAGTAGAAAVSSDVPVGASAIFTVLDSRGQFQTEAGVGDSPASKSLTLPVDIHGNFDTGVAFFNPGTGTISLNYRLLDTNGVVVNSTTQPLVSKGHLATFVDNLFPGIGSFDGTLAVSTDGSVAATTLRQYASGVTYTTLPTVSGTSTGSAAIPPLLSNTLTGITARSNDPNVVVSGTLPSGFFLSGTISGAGQGILVVASAGGNSVVTGSVDALTGRYLLVLPAGSYSLRVCYQPSGVPSAAGVTLTYVDPVAVQVPSDSIRDITLPGASLFNVSGTLSGLTGLSPGANTTIVFTSTDNATQGRFTPDAGDKYVGVLPAGSYLATLRRDPIQFSPLQSESLQLYNIGTLTVAGGPAADFSIPATARLSGTVVGGGSLIIPAGTRVTATDTSAPAGAQLSCCASPAVSYATSDLSGKYQMALSQGRSYSVTVAVQPQGPSLFGELTYPLTSGAVQLGADASLDFPPPGLPGFATIYGTVTDNLGSAVPNVVVTASSQSLDTPNVGFSIRGETNKYGNYSLQVLSGTNYQVTFSPPVPLP
jgi:hypothetical protein